MPTNLTNMQPHHSHGSSELSHFDATLNFSGGSDFVAAHCTVGQSMTVSSPPHPKSRSTTLEQLFKDDNRSKQLSSSGAKLGSFVNFIFRQTKSKSKSTNIPQARKTLKTCPLLRPNILPKELRNFDSCKSGNAEPFLVHQPMHSEKSTTDIDGFVEYMGLLHKDTEGLLKDDTIWFIESLSSLWGRRSIRRAESKMEDDNDDDCDISVCSSDLFELREL